MKKIVLSITVMTIFIISSFSVALAKPGNNGNVPGQAKNRQVQIQKQVINTTPSSIEKSFGTIKKEAMPPVIKIGNLQISTSAVIKGFKATLVWDKTTNTITISKNGITISFIGDSKVFVNGVQVSIKSIKNGKGKLVPMEFIQKILNSRPEVPTTTDAGITTTGSAITTTESAVITTGSAITTTDSAVITTDSSIITTTNDGK